MRDWESLSFGCGRAGTAARASSGPWRGPTRAPHRSLGAGVRVLCPLYTHLRKHPAVHCRATEALCAGLAVELRLALANQHSSTFRSDPVLLPADEPAAAHAFAAWPTAYDRTRHMTNNEAHVRVPEP